MFKASPLYKKNYNSTAKVVVNQGGTSSGKTYSILQVLFTKACENPDYTITVVGQDVPNLKSGALRDAQDIVAKSEEIQSCIASYNKSDRVYTFNNGSLIEFKSFQNPQDAKAGKRQILFVNEANGIPYPIFQELYWRSYVQTFIDYNPNSRFWVHEHVIPDPYSQLIISDHRHNPFLDADARRKIEAIKLQDEELWKVYARGLTGKITGLIFPNCSIVDKVPPDAKLIGRGMDFGYSNDPTTLYGVYKHNGNLVLDEELYDTGYTNPMLRDHFRTLGLNKTHEIIADSADPKSIAELCGYGFNVQPAAKGADSIINGIDILKRWKILITARSKGLRREQAAYKWKVDKAGVTLNEPVDAFNHGWDAVRYLALKRLSVAQLRPNSSGFTIRTS